MLSLHSATLSKFHNRKDKHSIGVGSPLGTCQGAPKDMRPRARKRSEFPELLLKMHHPVPAGLPPNWQEGLETRLLGAAGTAATHGRLTPPSRFVYHLPSTSEAAIYIFSCFTPPPPPPGFENNPATPATPCMMACQNKNELPNPIYFPPSVLMVGPLSGTGTVQVERGEEEHKRFLCFCYSRYTAAASKAICFDLLRCVSLIRNATELPRANGKEEDKTAKFLAPEHSFCVGTRVNSKHSVTAAEVIHSVPALSPLSSSQPVGRFREVRKKEPYSSE